MSKTTEVNETMSILNQVIVLTKKEQKLIKLALGILYTRANVAGRLEVLNKVS